MNKKYFAKTYNIMCNSLKGSGLSKYQNVRRIHSFIAKQLKSEFVDVYGYSVEQIISN